jgi:hypothetical protein
VELRALGLSLSEVTRVLGGEAPALERALALHEATREARVRQLGQTVQKVRRLRAELSEGALPVPSEIVTALQPSGAINVAIDLPWPWGGERFELRGVTPLNIIVGPLGSGKTRLAMRLAEEIPGGKFLGLDRLANGAAGARSMLASDPQLKSRVEGALAAIVEDGGAECDALLALLAALEADDTAVHVIDMLEQGLDASTQEAVIAFLRRRAPSARPLFFLTRSNVILDLDSISVHDTVILCPANHAPPTIVAPYRGAPGYEAVATCLASPDARARTEGVIAWRQSA